MEFLGRESVAYLGYCVAEPKSGSQEVGTRSNPDLTEGKCLEEREEMDSHLENIWSFYLSSLFQLS